MKQKITLLLLFLFGSINAQNLVLNPSFEEYIDCPWQIGRFNRNVKNWSTPNLGTTDFFSTCSNRVGKKNYNGFQNPKHEKSYAGIYLYSRENYREYIQGKISKTLIQGKKYKLTFYISLADKSTHAIKDIEVLFTEEELGFKYINSLKNKSVLTHKTNVINSFKYISKKYINPKKYTRNSYKKHSFSTNQFYDNCLKWTELSIEFTANGFEKFFTIGNFNSNKKTKKRQLLYTNNEKQQFAYYYIDDVNIELIKKEINQVISLEEKIEAIPLKTETVYTFNNVLFDFDKAKLINTSIDELDKLSLHLKEKQNLNIEIYGHTDNVGLTKRNNELSLQRAKAVSDYLILKGLKKERIQYFGFGSSSSLVENSSEDNRAKNRRVEFKLINKN